MGEGFIYLFDGERYASPLNGSHVNDRTPLKVNESPQPLVIIVAVVDDLRLSCYRRNDRARPGLRFRRLRWLGSHELDGDQPIAPGAECSSNGCVAVRHTRGESPLFGRERDQGARLFVVSAVVHRQGCAV